MREIKFRGKTLYGKWVYGWLFEASNKYYIVESTAYISKDYYGDEILEKQHFEEVIPATVGMYTGLKDKAGTEIWEGDLLVSPADNRTYEVRWNQGAFWLFHKPYTRMDKLAASGANVNEIGTDISKFGYCSKLAVIGTIHDKAEGE